jgi:hypothetical protein
LFAAAAVMTTTSTWWIANSPDGSDLTIAAARSSCNQKG